MVGNYSNLSLSAKIDSGDFIRLIYGWLLIYEKGGNHGKGIYS
jgi:hypothetical protein